MPVKLDPKRFGEGAPLYAFTTENLTGYFPHLSLVAKRCLCVCGSGDHLINAALFGAAAVVAFDINRLALAWAQLKVGALLHLSYAEFLRFFMRPAPKEWNSRRASAALDYRVYLKFRPALKRQCRESFDRLYDKFEGRGLLLRESQCFNNRHDRVDLKLRCNPYLQDPRSYRHAQKALVKTATSYRHANIVEVSQGAKLGNFDLILLSNIADYCGELFPPQEGALARFAERVVKPLGRKLRAGGQIGAAYLYDYRKTLLKDGNVHSEADRPSLRRSAFKQEWHTRYLESASVMPGKVDALMLLTPREV